MQIVDTRVFLCPQSSYEPQSLKQAVDTVLTPGVGRDAWRSAKILLKPNLITATNARLSCTNSQLITTVAGWLLDQGAQVTVGDSPAFGSAHSVLRAIGALPELERLGVRIAEFRRKTTLQLSSGIKAHVAVAALDCDYLLNLPKVKAHGQMRMTLAIKNYFGCVAGLHKPLWHMVHGGDQGLFADLLVQLLAVLPAGFSLVDGIEAMHVTGPIHGQPFRLGVLAGGVNPVAVDSALLAVLGVNPQSCPLWRVARALRMAGTEEQQLQFPLAAPEELAISNFLIPEELMPVRFNPIRFCTSTLRRWYSTRRK